MRAALTLTCSLFIAAALTGGASALAAATPPAANDQANLERDAHGKVDTDAMFAFMRARSATKGEALSEKKLQCYGVSRAQFLAAVDASLVACYPQIAPENRVRILPENVIPAFGLCARKTLLAGLKLDPGTANACVAKAD
ncbi:hypothetical protein CR152_19375 [Massilia violaceinigra]|uniref:Secreted protein n=1 Tax=Massilia violaceinigra TaxID=2045208 RepID=A0A2D2DN76_9BURK|nr:hypothetical protein [Massilia violaceinigra]ATQ76445.1 hypothetical protein CR152_19375 [Massilia violaceinigra]